MMQSRLKEIPLNFLQKLNYHIMKNSNEVSSLETITQGELRLLLEPITVSTVISITYIVDDSKSRMVDKKRLLQKEVFVGNLYLNHDYAKKVSNLSGEAFEALPMNGKTRISTTLVMSDKSGEMLLDGKILAKESRKTLNYFHNGEVIERSEAERLNYFYPPTTKPTSGRGLLTEENDFQMITLGLKNIKSLKVFGKSYVVLPI